MSFGLQYEMAIGFTTSKAVCRGEWPYEYVGPSRASNDKAMDTKGGQQ